MLGPAVRFLPTLYADMMVMILPFVPPSVMELHRPRSSPPFPVTCPTRFLVACPGSYRPLSPVKSVNSVTWS